MEYLRVKRQGIYGINAPRHSEGGAPLAPTGTRRQGTVRSPQWRV